MNEIQDLLYETKEHFKQKKYLIQFVHFSL